MAAAGGPDGGSGPGDDDPTASISMDDPTAAEMAEAEAEVGSPSFGNPLGVNTAGLSPETISFTLNPAQQQQPGLMQGLLGLFGRMSTDVLGNTPGFAGGTVGSLSKAANSISDPTTAAEVAAAQAAMAGLGPDASGGGDGFDLPTTSGLLRLASALGSSPAIPNATSGILSRPQYQFLPNRWDGNRFIIPSLTPIV